MANRADSLNRFCPRVCESAYLIRIPRLGMRCAGPMASLAALLRQLFFFQCLHMRGLGKALVLILVTALADFGTCIFRCIDLPERIRCLLSRRWKTGDCKQTHKRQHTPTRKMTSWLHELWAAREPETSTTLRLDIRPT